MALEPAIGTPSPARGSRSSGQSRAPSRLSILIGPIGPSGHHLVTQDPAVARGLFPSSATPVLAISGGSTHRSFMDPVLFLDIADGVHKKLPFEANCRR